MEREGVGGDVLSAANGFPEKGGIVVTRRANTLDLSPISFLPRLLFCVFFNIHIFRGKMERVGVAQFRRISPKPLYVHTLVLRKCAFLRIYFWQIAGL